MSGRDLDDKIGDGLARATQRQFAGDTDAAIGILEDLEKLARPSKNPGLAYVLIQKAGWLRELGRIKEAQSALDEAESLSHELPAADFPLPGLRMEQGIVARRAGDLPKAESFLKDARRLAMGSPIEVVMMSDILANLSSAYSDMGLLEDAQTALLDAIEYDQKTRDPRALASNLNMLGMLYVDAGDRKTGRVYVTQSKEIAAEAGLVKESADATHNLAIIAELEGSTEARAGFLEALESAVKAGRRPDIASSKTSLGILAARERKFQEARDFFTEAHAIHSELGLAEFCVNDLVNLAHNELSLKNPKAALEYAKAALAMAKQRGLVQILWAAHYCMARAQAAALGQEASPDPKILNDVLASYMSAADAIELLRAGIGRPEERERLLVDKEQVYQEGMMLAGVLRRGGVAWAFAERSRGRAFLDSLGAARIGHQAGKHPLGVRRTELTRQLLESQDSSGAGREAILDELRMVRSLIHAQAPVIAAVTETELPSIQEIAALIPEDSALVEFYMGPGNRLTTFVLNQKGFAAMHTSDLGTLDLPGMIKQFQAEVQYDVKEALTGSILFAALFSGVWDVIEPVGRLFIVPHRELHYIPFAALWLDNTQEGPEHIFVCQRFRLSIVPSASYFAHIMKAERSKAAPSDSLVMGNPTEDLPASEAEASAVASLLGVSPVLGAAADRDRLLGIWARHAVVHIASHGVYDERDPLLSGILLADGRLSVEDLLDAEIPADLLTLSGCLTGVSSQEPGDELIGLSRAALAAGVPSVITTLWEVGDDATREFFQRFYWLRRKGIGKDEALGSAQQSMVADERYASPSNWAPYVLLGDYR